jgi:hypothetical protein
MATGYPWDVIYSRDEEFWARTRDQRSTNHKMLNLCDWPSRTDMQILFKIEIVNDVLIRCQQNRVRYKMYKLLQICLNPLREGSDATVDARVRRFSASDPPTNDSDLDPLASNQRQQRTATVALWRKIHRDRPLNLKIRENLVT